MTTRVLYELCCVCYTCKQIACSKTCYNNLQGSKCHLCRRAAYNERPAQQWSHIHYDDYPQDHGNDSHFVHDNFDAMCEEKSPRCTYSSLTPHTPTSHASSSTKTTPPSTRQRRPPNRLTD
uniref:Uncharacterized protein n=1 Tax=Magallana gigas TaxID=29159 RepID=A0A8W8MHA0_MAGGI